MLQIWKEVSETACRLGSEYGPYVALGVVLMVAAGIALRLLRYCLTRGQSRSPS